MAEPDEFRGWAILELMGHRRLAGFVQPVTLAGKGVIRIDVPGRDGGDAVMQMYSPDALYCLTPTDEATARAVAMTVRPETPRPLSLQLPTAQRRHDFRGDGGECELCGGAERADWPHAERTPDDDYDDGEDEDDPDVF